MGKRIDLTGQNFGRWKVLYLDEEKTKQKRALIGFVNVNVINTL